MAFPFPTPGILDNFDRANAGPPPSSSWTDSATESGLIVVGNQLGASAAGNKSSWWNVATYGPDCEVYVDIPTMDAGASISIDLGLRLTNPASASENGYIVELRPDLNRVRVYRRDAGASTQISVTDTSQTWASGDSFGFSAVGALLTVWRKPSAGSWTPFLTITDTTYESQSGNLRVQVENTTNRLDNFGGGTRETAVSYLNNVLYETPFVYLRLDESSGSVIEDFSGYNRDGAYGAATAAPTLGATGAILSDAADDAATFDGSNDYGSVALNLSALTTITVEFWLKWDAFANDADLAMEFTPDQNLNNGSFIVHPNSNSASHSGFFEVAMLDSAGPVANTRAITRPSAGEFHHYVIILRRGVAGTGAINIYVDGVDGGAGYHAGGSTDSIPGNFANDTLYLMSRGGVSGFGAGTLDEVAIYSGTLSATRILAHYEAAFEAAAIGSYYQRIFGPGQLEAAATTLYTVPDDARVEVRSLDLNNPSGSLRKVTLSIGSDAAGTRVEELLDVPAGESLNKRRGFNHTLEEGEVLQGYAGADYEAEVLADSPAVYYRCQEASGQLQDSSGNARHTTYINASPTYQQPTPITTDATDKSIGLQVASFDYFTTPDSGLDFGDGPLSLECWIKRASASGNYEGIFDKGSGAYILFIGPDNKMYFSKTGGSAFANESGTTADTNWHHFVATKNGASFFLYKDGVDVTVASADQTLVNNAIALHIGTDAAIVAAWDGFLDELALYPSVLSPARVLAHYEAAAAGDVVATIDAWVEQN